MHQNLLKRLYAWACERLYAELAGSYDHVSWLVSLGRWDRWRALALDYSFPANAQAASRPVWMGQNSADAPLQRVRVLEIGFGTGELLARLAQRSALTVGLELSSAMQQQTDQKLTQQRVILPRVQARAQAMPFADSTFDTIVATFPAPYIVESATLRECARLLLQPTTSSRRNNFQGHTFQGDDSPSSAAQGGRLVIVGLWVTVADTWWARFVPLFYGRPSPAWLAYLSAQLTAAGFRPMISERTDGWARVGVVVAERTGHLHD